MAEYYKIIVYPRNKYKHKIKSNPMIALYKRARRTEEPDPEFAQRSWRQLDRYHLEFVVGDYRFYRIIFASKSVGFKDCSYGWYSDNDGHLKIMKADEFIPLTEKEYEEELFLLKL